MRQVELKNGIKGLAAVAGAFFVWFVLLAPPSTEPPRSNHGGYINTDGETVRLSDFFGKYLWVDHAAQWCSYCGPQTNILKKLHNAHAGSVDFLTVVTGTTEVMEGPTAATARDWARRYGLDPAFVIARFQTDTLPYHLFYAPDGRVLFTKNGFMQAAEIKRTLKRFVQR